jgi:hypothetical protein
MTYEPEIPTPNNILSIGPPKQAEKPIIGANAWVNMRTEYRGTGKKNTRTATVVLATKSAIEFPAANIVKPMIASDSPKIKPKVCEA